MLRTRMSRTRTTSTAAAFSATETTRRTSLNSLCSRRRCIPLPLSVREKGWACWEARAPPLVLLRRSTCLATCAFLFLFLFLLFPGGGGLGGARAAASAREEALLPCYFCIIFCIFIYFFFAFFGEGLFGGALLPRSSCIAADAFYVFICLLILLGSCSYACLGLACLATHALLALLMLY
jgi:hypothetical protein